ncbi:MAG: hypothetical protein LBH32_13035 [Dysgonamonadaceae bacterium]|jgi:hypothetical protein|nr:hypothetical protein [Dysgonamonadaceae bacterium]
MIELSKSQKKIARELIQLGLQRECKSFTDKITKLTNSSEWKIGDPHEIYLKLYKKVISFDKKIARRYNGLTGSHYFLTVYGLFMDKVLTVEDIACFDVEVQNELIRMKNLYDTDNQ